MYFFCVNILQALHNTHALKTQKTNIKTFIFFFLYIPKVLDDIEYENDHNDHL